jgi:hypothetical protein
VGATSGESPGGTLVHGLEVSGATRLGTKSLADLVGAPNRDLGPAGHDERLTKTMELLPVKVPARNVERARPIDLDAQLPTKRMHVRKCGDDLDRCLVEHGRSLLDVIGGVGRDREIGIDGDQLT